MRIIEARKSEITVQRPDGSIETLIHPNVDYFTDALLRQANQAMAAAGRGTILSYRNIEAVVEMEDSDYEGRCDRCGARIDTRTAYTQQERDYFAGKTVQVAAYYCDSCHTLLTAIGRGEHTPMEERTEERPDNTPHTRQEED
jgi:Zn finger protein HypA/HybF involved in hydrogenase expression